MQSDWRWCNKCQALAFSLNQPSNCPAGGSHDHTGSGNYTLALDDPSAKGQSGWKWCRNCQALAFAVGLTSPSRCPAGGGHDYSESGDYTLRHDDPNAPGQAGWKWCSKCQGLAFSLNQPSVCPAGGAHDHRRSGNYTLGFLQDELATSMSFGEEVDEPSGAVSGKYWPGEIEESHKSGGHVLDVPPPGSGGEGAALLSDFEPCSSELRPSHAKVIGLIRTRMGWPSGRHDGHLLEVYGMTDEIEGFMTDSAGLDRLRAFAVKRAFDSTGVFITMGPSTTKPGQDDPDVLGLGVAPDCVGPEGSSPGKRAAARSVSVKYSLPPSKKVADKKSKKWKITQVFASALVYTGGLVEVVFILKNATSGQEYLANFSGRATGDQAALQFGVGAAGSIPGLPHFWSDFETYEPIAASAFDDPKSTYEVLALEAHAPPVGAGFAHLELAWVPKIIDLKFGPEISVGLTPISTFKAKGSFTVVGPKPK